MKVLVVGATGLTGSIAVRLLLARGDQVTALARSPEAITARPEGLRVAKGEARDLDSLVAAVTGQDAVLSTFGPREIFAKSDLQETYMRNLIAAMHKASVKRLVNLSAWGALGSDFALNWLSRAFRGAAHNYFADKDRGEALLLASDLDFINARPPRLTNGPARGNLKASLDPKPLPFLPWLSREDLASFMVLQLSSDAWLRQSPLIWH
jgi:uncharacterized protein YbjT (DUF2867 family)